MTQSPIETRHKDMAAKASNWPCYTDIPETPYFLQTAILAHAQTLANDEAKGKALAEIITECEKPGWGAENLAAAILTIAAPYRASDPEYGRAAYYGCVHTDGSRSGGQPVTSCPDCEAFKREVSDACKLVDGFLERDRNSEWKTSGDARKTLRRFIIPASDPVAEALTVGEAIEDYWNPDPEDPFWMLEKDDGSWLKNRDSQLTTREPAKAIRYPSQWHADAARRNLVGQGWLLFKPTEHLWCAFIEGETT